MFAKIVFVILLITAFSLPAPKPVLAVNVPDFPSCANPQGTVKASYSSGVHGIVGKTETFTGSDSVYQLTGETLVQCFCTGSGQTGIQTNWWKVSSLTAGEIQILINQGWASIPNGSLWGLEAAPYIAKNSSYAWQRGTRRR